MNSMASILLKNVPPQLHRRLKLRAAAERRSLQQETMFILEFGLGTLDARRNHPQPPVPFKMRIPVTQAFLDEVRRERNARY
ncbi:MAG TPA: hypothetical protein VHC86_15630 [Opitutaceae bacterium]|nr:hypothetical protein [Opitutaceae bacterium]